MDMKAIDISISGDFNITIMNDENSGDSTSNKNHDGPGQTTDHPLQKTTADVRQMNDIDTMTQNGELSNVKNGKC